MNFGIANAARPTARWLLGAMLLLPACGLAEDVTSFFSPEYRATLEHTKAIRELRQDFDALAATLGDATGSEQSAVVARFYGSWLDERSGALRAAIERLRLESDRQQRAQAGSRAAQFYYRRAAAALTHYTRAVDYLDMAIKNTKRNAYLLRLAVKLSLNYARAEWGKGDDELR